MANKFYGAIGYTKTIETAPGVWRPQTTERNYRGDVILNQERHQPSDGANDNLNLDNSISIIADEYAYKNAGYITYIVWHGVKWKIQSIAINRPRIVLQIGGVYNGG